MPDTEPTFAGWAFENGDPASIRTWLDASCPQADDLPEQGVDRAWDRWCSEQDGLDGPATSEGSYHA